MGLNINHVKWKNTLFSCILGASLLVFNLVVSFFVFFSLFLWKLFQASVAEWEGYWSAVQASQPVLQFLQCKCCPDSVAQHIMGTVLIVFHSDLKFSAWLADLIMLCLYLLWIERALVCFPLLGPEEDLHMLLCWQLGKIWLWDEAIYSVSV